MIPQHFKYIVQFEDKIVLINSNLIVKQKAFLKDIIDLHYWKLGLEAVMRMAKKSELADYDKLYDGIEFCLQDAWGFIRHEKYHRFWRRPRCECPKMDNEDIYPTGVYIKAQDCPLHGWEKKRLS